MKFKELFEGKEVDEKYLVADKLQQYWDDFNMAYCQVYINPDANEIKEICSDFKRSDPESFTDKAVRGYFDKNGNLYCWYITFFHEPVFKKFKLPVSKPFSSYEKQSRFSYRLGDRMLTTEYDEAGPNINAIPDSAKKLHKAFPELRIYKDEDTGKEYIKTIHD